MMPFCMFMEGVIAWMLVMEILMQTIDELLENWQTNLFCGIIALGLFLIWGKMFKQTWTITGHAQRASERNR